MVLTHCLPPTRGALQPETPRTMRSRAAGTFDATFVIKINVAIIIIMQPVYLCRRTPFMISSLHVTKVMMLNMIMTHEEGLWLSMQPVCLCRRTPFMISSLHVTKVIILIMIMTARRYCGSYSRRSSACDSANHAILGSENV